MTVTVETGVPVPPLQPSRNVFKRLGVKLPWDSLDVGGSFFMFGGQESDRASIYVAASRRKMKIRTEVSEEGMRVWRTA